MDRPIIFSGPMVRALLNGRKSQTRRVLSRENLRIMLGGFDTPPRWVKPDAELLAAALTSARGWRPVEHLLAWETDGLPYQVGSALWTGKLNYAVGDRLWVRESYCQVGHWEPVPGQVTRKAGRQKWRFVADDERVVYEAPDSYRKGRHTADPETSACHLRAARFMPRRLSRLTLTVTKVRVQRLQAISEKDAVAEGCPGRLGPNPDFPDEWDPSPQEEFQSLWTSLHGPAAWAANPWVAAISFTVQRGNIDQIKPEGE